MRELFTSVYCDCGDRPATGVLPEHGTEVYPGVFFWATDAAPPPGWTHGAVVDKWPPATRPTFTNPKSERAALKAEAARGTWWAVALRLGEVSKVRANGPYKGLLYKVR